MSKITSAEEWIEKMPSMGVKTLGDQVKYNLYKAIIKIQEQARQATLEVAAENARSQIEHVPFGGYRTVVVKDSITSLISHADLKVE